MDKSSYPNGRLLKLAINERQSLGMIPVNVVNSQGQAIEVKEFQQMLSPATPTVETLAVKSDFDKYGGTIAKALGKNLINFKLIKSAYGTTVTTITNGININGTYYGSVHINLNVGETYVMDWDTEIISGSPQNAWRIEYIDGTYSLITSKGVSILIEKEVKNVYLYVNLGTSTEANYTNIQLELGTVPTAYVLWEGYHLDELGTIPAEDDTPISCDSSGTLFAYNSLGEMPKAESIGSIKQNFVVCDVSGTPISAEFQSGNYIKIADDYFTESFDLNNILYDSSGNAKIIAYDDLANITNNQLFVSLDKQKIMFYETPLTGDCLYRACKALKLNEPYMVQTAEGSGEYEPYITADGMLYVLKEGVTVSR